MGGGYRPDPWALLMVWNHDRFHHALICVLRISNVGCESPLPHETEWGNLGAESCVYSFVCMWNKNCIHVAPSTARHFPIAVASFMRSRLDYIILSVVMIYLTTVSVVGYSAVAAATNAFHIMVSLLPAIIKSSVWLTSVASSWRCISICTSSRRCSCCS